MEVKLPDTVDATMARRKSYFLAWFFLVCILSTGLLLLTPIKTNADVHINEGKLSITISPGTDLNFTLEAGVFSSVTQNFAISTTAAAGYTVTMETEGYNTGASTIKTTDLVNVINDTIRIPTITVPTPGGTITSSNFTTGYGYSTDAVNYRPVPAINATDTIARTSVANLTPNNHTLSFGGRVGTNVEPGIYSNSFNVQIVANLVPYTVYFDKNGGEGTMLPQAIPEQTATALNLNQFTRTGYGFIGWNTKPDGSGDRYADGQLVTDLVLPGGSITLYAQWSTCLFNSVCYQGNGADAGLTMADQTTDATATTTTLWAPNFKRAGYGFVSWNTKPDGTGTDYGPNQTIDQTLTKDGLKLYAKWLQSDGTPLQNWGGCASLNIGDSIALTDTRDNDVYTVTKLADGNCWMTENLRLGGNSPISITTANTDSPTNFTLPASVSWFCSFGDSECAPEMDHLRLNASNTTATVAEMTSPDSNVYSYGNYYNWYAATAGTGTYHSGTMHNGVTAPNSICPKGWALPTGDNTNSGSFAYLNISFGGTSNPSQDNPTLSNVYRSYPNNFVFSGHFDSDHLSIRGEYASLSSATARRGDENDINLLYLSSTYVYPGQINDYPSPGYDGYSIRCLTTDTKVSSYTVKFDANGGTGNMSPKNIVLNQPTTLPSNAFTAPESWQTFNGWTTNPDGTGDFYTNAEVLNTPIANSGEVITLYALWGCPPNKICYNENGASASPTKMGQQSASAGTDTTLWANNFQYSGYGFAGWSPDKDASAKLADPANALTSPVVYGPNETIVTPSDLAQKGLTLYAVWIKSAGDIQAWRGCDSLNFGQLTALTDTRDNQTYAVSKLADGTCWTMENLRLDSTATITAENTDNPVAGFTLPASSAPSTWCQADNKNCINQATLYSINTTNPVSSMNNKNNNAYSYGNYYNYASATAGHGRYGENLIINQPGSVCPAGWHLPTARTPGLHNDHPGSYTYLNQQLGGGVSSENNEVLSNAWRSYPNNLIYSGEVTNGNLSQLGDAAYYWSSTPSISVAGGTSSSDYTFATIANIVASNFRVAPGMLSTKRYYGTTLRCVVRDAYTVKFDANGGSGDMPDQTIYTDVATKLSANTFISTEPFAGWTTNPDGTGNSYTDGEKVTDLVGKGETITLYAQWGCPPGNICYDKNGAANSPTNMGRQSVGDSDTSALLWPSNFQRSGYGFAGWNTKADGTGTMYGPNETISDDATINNIKTDGLALYATWIKSAGDIQGWNGCATMNIGDVTALTDKRDNQTYAVAKLADGKCWMTENLRLDNQYTTSAEDIALSQGYGTGFIGLAEPEFSNFDYSTASNSLYSAADVNNNNTQMPRYNNINTANAVETLTSWTGTENIYSLGNYYTWTAIVANVDKVLIRNVSLSSISICPAGWRLPRGGDKNNQANNDVWDLIVNHFNNGVPPSNYNNTDQPIYLNEGEELIKIMTKYPNNFVYSGRYEKDSPNNRSTIGSFWTSTFYSEYGNAYNFGMVSFSKSVNPGTSSASKFTGMPARCVVDERYTVSFDANGGSGDMADQSIQVGIATKLSANTFTNSPKSFVGWNTKPDGTGDFYTDEEEVTDLVGKGETITLYAQWAEPTPLEQISTMQEMTPGICSATPVGTEAVLKDTRDGKTYSVAKLKDGNCWMIENLDHDIDATKTYTPADTDISSNWTPDVSTINIQGLNVGENVSGWVGAFGDNGLASADPGEVYWDGSTNRHSKIGNYYNWTAALAVNDSGAYSNGTETDPSQNPQTSICPKGWRLPIIANEITGHVDEFKELNRLYNNGVNSTDSGLIASPLYFTRGGAIDQSSALQSVGDAGSYWSSTAGGPMYVFNTAYYFNHDASYNDSYSSNIAYGYNIRCVARNDYKVSFNANSGSGNMADQIIARGISAKLKANEFSAPSGFVFDGWNTEANGSGTSYANEATVTNLADAGGTITLYAQWKDTRTGFDRMMTMQDMTSAICAEAAVGDTKRLRDTRDDKYYNIRKMEDGKCWMVQNLALGSTMKDTVLTSADSDVSTNFTIPSSNVYSSMWHGGSSAYGEVHVYLDESKWILPPTTVGGATTYHNTGTPANQSQYIGAYYNWYTATAGTGTSALASGNATGSICPKGWRLPTGGSGTDNDIVGFTKATVNVTGNNGAVYDKSYTLQNSPYFIGLFGGMGPSSVNAETGWGAYWSSTAYNSGYVYSLYLENVEINPQYDQPKASGVSIRCVAR